MQSWQEQLNGKGNQQIGVNLDPGVTQLKKAPDHQRGVSRGHQHQNKGRIRHLPIRQKKN